MTDRGQVKVVIDEVLKPAGTPMKRGWRLVCHRCGHRYPTNTAFNASAADCCAKPNLHVHNLDHPCGLCSDGGEE